MIHDAFVRVTCDAPHCSSEEEIDLPFVYSGVMHAVGHYDHSDSTVEKRLKKAAWIVNDGKHYCSPECAEGRV